MCRKLPNGTWRYCPSRRATANEAPTPSPSEAPQPPPVLLVHLRHAHSLDDAQAHAVLQRCWDHAPEFTEADDIDPASWNEWCHQQSHEALTMGEDTDSVQAVPDVTAAYTELAAQPPPAPRAFHTYQEAMGTRAAKAERALRRQVSHVAAMRGVDTDTAAERIRAYRDQYHSLPFHERPAPPDDWVFGFTRKDTMSMSVPRDPATLWAYYRAQADPAAFPTQHAEYASIDLETAGPRGKEGFEPQHGCIIEVGIVTFDEHGQGVGRLSELVRPAPEAEHTYRTGAQDIHGIAWDDVKDAPEWEQVSGEVQTRLDGRLLLAQNDRFERSWLTHHMADVNRPFDRYTPGIDTLCVARQHYSDLPNHRLATICDAVGVPYTNGHRATHDAEAAARAFFEMRSQIHARYRSDGHTLPQPDISPFSSSPVTRLRAGDFDEHDPWAVSPP